MTSPEPAPLTPRVPPPLTVAASLVAFEGVVLVIQGLTLIPGLHGGKFAMSATTLVFFLVYGVFLGVCALQIYRLHSWARAPIVLAQLIQILVGASFWGGATTIVAIVSIVVGLVALAGIFHPASLEALDPTRGPDGGS